MVLRVSKDKLERWQAAIDAAPPGPWGLSEGYEQMEPGYYVTSPEYSGIIIAEENGTSQVEALEFAVAARTGWPEAIQAFKMADHSRQAYAKTANEIARENAQLRRTLENNIENLHRIANVIDEEIARDLIESLIAHNGEILAAERREVAGDYAGLLGLGKKAGSMGHVSDGYHTLDELYWHRAVNFAALLKAYPEQAWKSRQHHDGTMFDDMFIAGIETPEGQYTYHIELSEWDMFTCRELESAPEWDGHHPVHALRLLSLERGGYVE